MKTFLFMTIDSWFYFRIDEWFFFDLQAFSRGNLFQCEWVVSWKLLFSIKVVFSVIFPWKIIGILSSELHLLNFSTLQSAFSTITIATILSCRSLLYFSDLAMISTCSVLSHIFLSKLCGRDLHLLLACSWCFSLYGQI